ncbi:cytochrome P450 [Nannocystis bainbridge]|uniref:Cytochrome P450 n=1 Tax=Nannocystis bainbridge TaxID=2995303 RepID=A0ABT5ED04_9BACT|nr:cytochrome P450 [Nannocystis bainbridge]MDC0723757.1 cytochrome P450 [Nannocystis bainbridge]
MLESVTSELKFDPFDPAFVEDPYPTFQRFREQAPIYAWEQAKGHIVFRYRDVMALIRDPRLVTDPTLGSGFSDELRAAYPDFVAMRENDLFVMRPESHARVRKLVTPLFGPRQLEAHRPRVVEIVREVLEKLPERGVINVFRDFAQNYPVRVIAAMLNIPPGAEAEFIAMADALIATIFPGLSPEVFASYMPAISRGRQIVRAVIADRRENPLADDLLTHLISACDDADRLSDGELESLIAGLIIGGSDTTVHLTTYAIMELLRNPEQMAILREDPSLARSALDETLRYNAFGRGGGLTRFVEEPFSWNGVDFHRGQPVFLNTQSALRDPEFVADPDVYDIRRRTGSSPWFGHGPHFCLGASLARLEAESALQQFLARYPTIELAGPPVYGDHPIFRDIRDLPVRVSVD